MLISSTIGLDATMHRIDYMILKYLLNAVARRIVTPKHPLFSRSYVVNNDVVSADSYDDTPFDVVPDVNDPPSVPLQIAAGERLKPMGSAPSTTVLSDAVFAQQFVRSFKAAADPVPPVVDPVPAAPDPVPAVVDAASIPSNS